MSASRFMAGKEDSMQTDPNGRERQMKPFTIKAIKAGTLTLPKAALAEALQTGIC